MIRRLAAAVALAGLALLVTAPAHAGTVPGGNHQGPPHPRQTPVGQLWGADVDAQIAQAIRVDDGTGTPFADSWLASGIAQRSAQGWDDPAATHYLSAAMNQPNPYGLGYPYDAFQNGTVNPASTIYAITLMQVGEVVLDAYGHGRASYSDITAIIDKLLAHPRIAVTPGIGLAYSDNRNDIMPGYSVHNVNQGVAIFLQDALDAGITYQATQTEALIAGLNQFESATYNPALPGWTYRNGGSKLVQDPGHNGIGAWWGQRFHPATIGVPQTRYMETTDYGYALGSGVHASLAQWDCTDSRHWLPQYDQYMADPTYQDFGTAAKSSRMMAQSATACGAPAPRGTFHLKPKAMRTGKSSSPHVAPDNWKR